MSTYCKARTTMWGGLAFAALACALSILTPASAQAGGKTIAGFRPNSPAMTGHINRNTNSDLIPLGGINRRLRMLTPSRPLGDTRGESFRRAARNNDRGHVRYKLVDMGTLGGAFSALEFLAKDLNNSGTLAGYAATSVPNPFYPNYMWFAGFNPITQDQHGFAWHNGTVYNLGTLPGGSSSVTTYINERGDIAGVSDQGLIDPVSGFVAGHAVLWHDGRIIDLGTLGGYESLSYGINDRDQVVGLATNGVADTANAFAPFNAQEHAFLWHHGVMRDLGTLGGPDSVAYAINDRGQVMGQALTAALAVHPFFWDDGKMTDIGTFGGTNSFPTVLNNRGQVSGSLNLPGDVSFHPFLWDRGKLTDLGTFGGHSGQATWMNDAGEVVGEAQTPIPCTGCEEPQVYHEFVWMRGVLTDLGQLPGTRCGIADGINESGQVVGTNGICHGGIDATIWERGSLHDLNDLIPADSSLHLVYATQINNCGEIAGTGVPPGVSVYDVNTKGHVFLLIPLRDEGERALHRSRCGDDRRFR